MNDKSTGSYYTPHELIDYMVSYINERFLPKNIIEPSAGDGRFVPFLKRFNCPTTLIESEISKFDILKSDFGKECTVVHSDFITYSHTTKKNMI